MGSDAARRVFETIDPAKDVDGFTAENVGRLVQNREGLVACTPAGVIELLEQDGVAIAGKRAVVIGRSDIVGKPMALLLLHRHATVTIAHSQHAGSASRRARGRHPGGGDRARGVRDAGRSSSRERPSIDVGMNRVSEPKPTSCASSARARSVTWPGSSAGRC